MKKVILAAVMGAVVLSVRADDAVDTNMAQLCGIYGGLGIGGSFLKNNASTATENYKTHKLNCIGGTVFLGGGKAFQDRYYVGGEVSIDFAGSKKYDLEKADGTSTNFRGKERGFIPTVALRLGFAKDGWLFYAKPVVLSSPKFTLENKTNNNELGSDSGLVYSLGLGVEKIICNKFSARVEAGYSLKSKKKTIDTVNVENHGGFNLRALVAYHVKF